MKEIKELHQDKIAIVKQAEQRKENKLVGRLKPCKGHTVYEVNRSTGIVSKAKYEEQIATYRGAKPSKKIMVNKNCIYVPALNLKNLMKKLIKAGVIDAK